MTETVGAGASTHRRLRKSVIVADLVGGLALGLVVALIAATVAINAGVGAMQTTVNGWSTIRQCGEPANNLIQQASCASVLPGVNLPQEAVYWTANVDAAGQDLNASHRYVLRFPSGDLPPTRAFWSITMTKARPRGLMVANSINRYSLGDHSNLARNGDGSIDIYLEANQPSQDEANWLPAPTGDFMLWLRDYQPGPSVLSGAYKVPPIEEAS